MAGMGVFIQWPWQGSRLCLLAVLEGCVSGHGLAITYSEMSSKCLESELMIPMPSALGHSEDTQASTDGFHCDWRGT
jgi:hypothetical protein